MTRLERQFSDINEAIEAVRNALILLHHEKYAEGMSFSRFRGAVFAELFLNEIKVGVLEFATLLEKFKGFKNLNNLNNYFRWVFGAGGISGVVAKVLTQEEQNRVIIIQFIKNRIASFEDPTLFSMNFSLGSSSGRVLLSSVLEDLITWGLISREVSGSVDFRSFAGKTWEQLLAIAISGSAKYIGTPLIKLLQQLK